MLKLDPPCDDEEQDIPQSRVVPLWLLNSVERLQDLSAHSPSQVWPVDCCPTPLQVQTQLQGRGFLNSHVCLNQTVSRYSQALLH